jgi:hypothetical protein
MSNVAADLVYPAMKLRNPVFFREVFIHLVGMWGLEEHNRTMEAVKAILSSDLS